MLNLHEDNSIVTTEEEPSVDFRQYLALLRQWWWLFVLAALLFGAAGYLYSLQQTPIYEASTTLLINQAPANETTNYSSLMTSEMLAQTYAEMMTKRPVMEKVIARLGIDIPPDEVASMLSVSTVRDTQLLNVTATGTDAGLDAAVANATALVFADYVKESQSQRYAASKQSLEGRSKEIEKQLAELQDSITKQQEAINARKAAAGTNPVDVSAETATLDQLESRFNQYERLRSNIAVSYEEVRLAEAQNVSSVVQVERAGVPTTPIGPKPMRTALLAMVVGLMLSVGGVFAYDFLDDSVKSPDEITKRFKLPVMGTIVSYDEPEDGRLIAHAQPRSPVTESFRALRTNVQYASVDKPLRTLLITSPAPTDGKTTVAGNLAVVMSQINKRVTVMDADLHRPRVHAMFRLDSRPGLTGLFIRPTVHLNGSLQHSGMDRLRVVSAGEIPPNPSELLGSNKMRQIMNAVLEQSDMLIIDTPPVLSVTDAVVLAPIVDGVLIVVRPGATKMSALKSAVEQLRYVGANVIGVVINRINNQSARYGYYYKSYSYKQYRYPNGNGKAGMRKAGKNGAHPAEDQDMAPVLEADHIEN